MIRRYNDLNSYMRSLFGERVQKLTVDAGFSCPNRDGMISSGGCIFCNDKGSGTGAHSLGLSVSEQIERSLPGIYRRYKANKYLIYFQAFTNTYAPVERLKAVYDEALSFDFVVGLSVGTRPDCVENRVLDLFESYAQDKLIWMEYGLQSPFDKTLALINRGHDYRCFVDAVKRTRNRNIKICAHIILGLPGETKEMMLSSAKMLGDLGVDGIKLHLLYVVKNTALERMYNKGEYKCMEEDEYVDIVCDYIERLPENIVIHRLTGDPHPAELVAPAWPLVKSSTMTKIKNTLEERNIFQGSKYD